MTRMRQPLGEVRTVQILRLKLVRRSKMRRQMTRFMEISVGRFSRREGNRCMVCQTVLSESAFGYCVRDITSPATPPQVLFTFCACEEHREILGQRMMQCLKLLVDPKFLEQFGGVIEEHRELQLNPVTPQLVLKIVHAHSVTLLPLMEALHGAEILPPIDGGLIARIKWLNPGLIPYVEWTFDITHIKGSKLPICCICGNNVDAEHIFGYRVWERNKTMPVPNNVWEFVACPAHHEQVRQGMELSLAHLQDAAFLAQYQGQLRTFHATPFLYAVLHHTSEEPRQLLNMVFKAAGFTIMRPQERRARINRQSKLPIEAPAPKVISPPISTNSNVENILQRLQEALGPLEIKWTHTLEDNYRTVILHIQGHCFVVKPSKKARKRYTSSHPESKRFVLHLTEDVIAFRHFILKYLATGMEEQTDDE